MFLQVPFWEDAQTLHSWAPYDDLPRDPVFVVARPGPLLASVLGFFKRKVRTKSGEKVCEALGLLAVRIEHGSLLAYSVIHFLKFYRTFGYVLLPPSMGPRAVGAGMMT